MSKFMFVFDPLILMNWVHNRRTVSLSKTITLSYWMSNLPKCSLSTMLLTPMWHKYSHASNILFAHVIHCLALIFFFRKRSLNVLANRLLSRVLLVIMALFSLMDKQALEKHIQSMVQQQKQEKIFGSCVVLFLEFLNTSFRSFPNIAE